MVTGFHGTHVLLGVVILLMVVSIAFFSVLLFGLIAPDGLVM